MLRIAICCGEGFASGFLAKRMNTLAKKEKLSDVAEFSFIPFSQLYDRQSEADVALLMPNEETRARADKREYDIPMYILPYKVVSMVKARDLIEDAEDIMELAGNKGGIHCFPGEERTALINRMKSHRQSKK